MQTVLKEKGYEVSTELAKGRFSNLFLCNDETNQYACKVYKNPARKKHSVMFDQIPILQKCNHPNIIKVIDHFQDGKIIFVLTEYCQHGNLSDFFNSGFIEHVRESTIRQLSIDLLKALQYLHDTQDVIHGYVHPRAVFVAGRQNNENGILILNLKLGGFARAIKSSEVDKIPNVHKVEGSPTYFSPERFNGEYGKEGDIWSLGVLLFQITYGRFPFSGTTFEEMKNNVTTVPFDGNKKSGDVGPWFPNDKVISSRGDKVFTACLTQNKDQRPNAATLLSMEWYQSLQETKKDSATNIGSKQQANTVINNPQKFTEAESTRDKNNTKETVQNKNDPKAGKKKEKKSRTCCGCC